ncbi:MAG: hypothetical protein FJ148_17685 [Deltaproteobacteria bacterium]|nr:hypothetical protein [Deltaproteobacteria bacterium]
MLLAAALRLVALDAGWFGVDQARDLAWAERIASGAGHPVVGPLMRNRFHLGSLYYEFWAIPARVSDGPLAAYAFAGLLGVVAVCLTWCLARRLAGPRAAVAAAALLATSPVAVIDARVAWAPAALPAWSAVVLLLATALVRSPTRPRAALLLLVAALGTQLHVAAAPLALVAGVIVLAHARSLGVAGIAFAAVAGVLPLLPMVAALAVPVPSLAESPVPVDPRQHRLGDLLQLVPRVLTGLLPVEVPAWVRAWRPLEAVIGGATLAAALVVAVWPPRRGDAAGVRTVAAFFWAGVGAVGLLPAEAWYYYLDMALVPGAVLLGVAGAALPIGTFAAAALVTTAVARTALLAWWIHLAAGNGYVPANLDWLRLGGTRPAAPDARARLLTVATREAAANVLVRDAGISPDRVWRDVHGPGFSDLDNDNGYFLHRAARGVSAGTAADPARSALVSYAGELPADWLSAFERPRRVGPLEIRTYVPTIDLAAAELRGCGGSLPAPAAKDPLAYGTGEPPLPSWPCAKPTVVVPVRAAPAGTVVRLLARTEGAARVEDLAARPPGVEEVAARPPGVEEVAARPPGVEEVAARPPGVEEVAARPPGTVVSMEAPGAGVGVEMPASGGHVEARLEVGGPARLDLYELHGLR